MVYKPMWIVQIKEENSFELKSQKYPKQIQPKENCQNCCSSLSAAFVFVCTKVQNAFDRYCILIKFLIEMDCE